MDISEQQLGSDDGMGDGDDSDCDDKEVEEYEYIDDDYYSRENSFTNNQRLTCDSCEKDFDSYYLYQKHMSEHRTCGIDDCTFTAHEKIIEKHIRMQHSTGLYDKIRNIATPEDIANWIEERKRKYPSKENIEKRYKQQEEMLKRGEMLEKDKDRFGRRNKTRLQKPHSLNHRSTFQKNDSARISKKRKRPPNKNVVKKSLIDERCDWNDSMFPFRGTTDLYKVETNDEVDHFDDNEWMEDSKHKTTDKLVLNNALGVLMNAYNSSEESDVEDVVPKPATIVSEDLSQKPSEDSNTVNVCDKSASNVTEVESLKNSTSDDEAPVEQKIFKVPQDISVANKSDIDKSNISTSEFGENKTGQNQPRSVRKRRKRGKHRNDEKAKRQRVNDKCNDSTGNESQTFIHRKFKKRRATLLEKLLEGEIRHERNVLLQCVRFVVNSSFFDKAVNTTVDSQSSSASDVI